MMPTELRASVPPPSQTIIRVGVVEDHHLVRKGICALLERAPDMEVVGEASSGDEALQMVQELNPDVLVMDLSMPRRDGMQIIAEMQSLDLRTKIVVVSVFADQMLVRQALRCGARGYLLKDSMAEELLLAVRAASQGGIYLTPRISSSVVSAMADAQGESEPRTMFERLTPRQREVLQLICEGHTNDGIATQLGVTQRTVERDRAKVMKELNVTDLPALVPAAIEHHLVFVDPDGPMAPEPLK